MLLNISNSNLFEKKLFNLKRCQNKINEEEFLYSFSCSYHGIDLNFKLKSKKFINSISKIVPPSWIKLSSGKKIYFFSPEELGCSPYDWADEVSQDCFSLENNTKVIQRDFAAEVFDDFIVLICEDDVGDGFYNFLRWYISEKLIDLEKYVIHASCVLDKSGKAHLFLGHSGAGKTTITSLAYPRLILGDDMNILNCQNNKMYVEAGAIGGLFNSMIGYDKKVLINSCYWLKQSDRNESLKLNGALSSQKIMASFANIFWPTFSEEKAKQLLSFSKKFASMVDCYELSFKNDSSIWEYLDP